MIWDGECHFCGLWIERWKVLTAGQVDYVTYQEAAGRFPEIPRDQFQRSVVFIEPDGKTRLVISNRARFPGSFYEGRELKRGDRQSTPWLRRPLVG